MDVLEASLDVPAVAAVRALRASARLHPKSGDRLLLRRSVARSPLPCSKKSNRAVGASVNSRCASSKKNTSTGFSGSPTSGSARRAPTAATAGTSSTARGVSSLSAARMFTTPRPCRRSAAGRRCRASARRRTRRRPAARLQQPRWMAPIAGGGDVAVLVVNSWALSPTYWSRARRSFRSSSSRPLSSANLNDEREHAAWVSLSSACARTAAGPCRRSWRAPDGPASRRRPRTRPGWRRGRRGEPRSFQPLASFGVSVPAAPMPARSPLTSAMKTGTPIARTARPSPAASRSCRCRWRP